MGRELKRVPLDFDHPVGETWPGFLNPHYARCSDCPDCRNGYTAAAQEMMDRWYGYRIPGRTAFHPCQTGSTEIPATHPAVVARARRNLPSGTEADIAREVDRLLDHFNGQWCHHLSQDDVGALVEAGRLPDLTRDDHHPTAAEVNDWSLWGIGHDGINQYVCVEARCRREGVESTCAACGGSGEKWESEEARKLADEWEPEEPPGGPGYQVWETVSEGSPISPVFGTPEELADWLGEHEPDTATREQWLAWIKGPGWAPSFVGGPAGLQSGVAAFGEAESADG